MTCESLDYICLYLRNQKLKFLIDTGASISIITSKFIQNHFKTYYDKTMIKGIGGKVQASSCAYIPLQLQNGVEFRHKFYLFDTVPCRADGIIGIDFLRNYNANIDLPTNRLALQLNNKEYKVDIQKRQCNNIDSKSYITIPSRSESIQYLNINKNIYKDCVLHTKQLEKHLFLACSIVQLRGKIPVKISWAHFQVAFILVIWTCNKGFFRLDYNPRVKKSLAFEQVQDSIV